MLKTVILLAGITCNSLFLSAQSFDAIDSKHGLSNNQVNAIVKDERGFIWFGTMSGLNRYDGYGFKIFKHKAGDSTTINDDFVNQLVQGPQHMLWAQTPNGWNVFDPRTEQFSPRLENYTAIVPDKKGHYWFVSPGTGIYKKDNDNNSTFYKNTGNITALTADNAGFIWIAYEEGIIEKRDTAYKLLKRTNVLQQYGQNLDYRIFADADNDLWIYSTGKIRGVYYYNAQNDQLQPIRKDGTRVRLNNDIINGITQDDKGIIWIATDHGGINLIDKKDFTVRYLLNNENEAKSLSQNSVNTIYKDDNGIVWLGTFKKGVNYFHESSLKFPLYQHPVNFVYNDVNRFVEDKKGNLWIGTNGGGLIYFDRKKGTSTQYLHDASKTNSLSNNVIVSLCIDKEDKLWIGTYYGGLDCFDGKNFSHYKHDEKNPFSIADDRVWEIFEDSRQRLWIGTLTEGLELFDRKENKFIRYKRPGSLSNYISSIIEDKQGNIWVGTDLGIDVLDKHTGLFRHYEHIENNKNSLSHSTVNDMLEDGRGGIWVATRDGLNLYNPANRTFKTYRTEDGLPDNTILTMLEDNNHHLWISTPNGISNVIVTGTGIQCKNYDEADGLQGRQFNENAAFKTRDGELLFGGANGFNLFSPSSLRENKAIPQLALTGLQIFNTPVKIGEKYNGRVVLEKSITEISDLTLKYNQNVFSIEFAALAYLNPNKIRYAYQLKGFNDEWLTANGKDRKATFTNLNPGEYTLLVRASNEDGKWSKPLALTIHILPPFWLTPFALITYVFLIIAALIYGRKLILRRAKMKFQIEQERQEAQRLHELDMMKIKFFTNVSHEFRTPLSLIITPVEKMIGKAQPEEKQQFQLIHRNARRLLNMVNQLLDFRKLEEQELKLNKTSGDIIRFLKELSWSFTDIAENKKISFSFHASQELLFTSFDQEKLERIMFNLLSNAFKFTPVGGMVAVNISTLEKTLQIKITDNGIGIPKDKQEKIFERFFQNEVPGSMVNQGSGIGLSITKEFVRLHGGDIRVESKVNEGSTFTVSLPITKVEEDLPKQTEQLYAPATRNKRKKSLLLVEDNDDFRFYIKDNLKEHYNIIEASNGKVGWQKALSEHPDLIVCDISMPEMNGIELCQKIRDDKRTSFIPLILLTALTGEEHQLEGLQTGASDYMTKPFNFEILLSKIKNLLSQQEQFKKTYQKQVQAQPVEIPTASANDIFIQQILAIIEKNMSNPDFSVEELSREMFMSRGALYKKMFSLTGQTPIEFIRSIRLQRAGQLLEKGEMTVAEVAYEVGFNNPKYFSKYFKMTFNVLPSAYQGSKNKN